MIRKFGCKLSIVPIIGFIFFIMLQSSVFASMPSLGSEQGVYVIEKTSGDVVIAQHENEKYYPASVTKLMTALVTIEAIGGQLDQQVVVGTEINTLGWDSSLADLEVGERYTWKELLYGMLLPSGNDAALTLAASVGRKQLGNDELSSEEAIKHFVQMMNDKAGEMGLSNTHFTNPHGLHHEDHYTTPKELVAIGQAALKNKVISDITNTKIYEVKGTTGINHVWRNSNVLLYENAEDFNIPEKRTLEDVIKYSGNDNPYYTSIAKGGKTGFEDEAEHCLLFSGFADGKEIVGVVLKASERGMVFKQSQDILKTVDSDYTCIVWSEGDKTYIESKLFFGHLFDGFKLSAKTSGVAASLVPKKQESNVKTTISWNSELLEDKGNYLKIINPFEAGEEIGTIDVYDQEVLLKQIPLIAEEGRRPMFWIDYMIIIGIPVIVILLIIVLVVHNRKKKAMLNRYEEEKRKAIIAVKARQNYRNQENDPMLMGQIETSDLKQQNQQNDGVEL